MFFSLNKLCCTLLGLTEGEQFSYLINIKMGAEIIKNNTIKYSQSLYHSSTNIIKAITTS